MISSSLLVPCESGQNIHTTLVQLGHSTWQAVAWGLGTAGFVCALCISACFLTVQLLN